MRDSLAAAASFAWALQACTVSTLHTTCSRQVNVHSCMEGWCYKGPCNMLLDDYEPHMIKKRRSTESLAVHNDPNIVHHECYASYGVLFHMPALATVTLQV